LQGPCHAFIIFTNICLTHDVVNSFYTMTLIGFGGLCRKESSDEFRLNHGISGKCDRRRGMNTSLNDTDRMSHINQLNRYRFNSGVVLNALESGPERLSDGEEGVGGEEEVTAVFLLSGQKNGLIAPYDQPVLLL